MKYKKPLVIFLIITNLSIAILLLMNIHIPKSVYIILGIIDYIYILRNLLKQNDKIKKISRYFLTNLFIISITLISTQEIGLINKIFIKDILYFSTPLLAISLLLIDKEKYKQKNTLIKIEKFALISFSVVLPILYIFIAKEMVITIDEGYTNNQIEAIRNFGEIGITESGAKYQRASIYSYLVYLTQFFKIETILNLRIVSIILSLLTVVATFFFAKIITKNKNLAIISSLLLSINWFFITIGLTARNYIFSLFLCTLANILIFKSLDETNNKKLIINSIGVIILLTLNYFEGFLVFTLHSLILISIIFIFKIRKIKYYIASFFIVAFLLTLVQLIHPSSLKFIINTFNFDLNKIYWEGLKFYGSVLIKVNYIGILLLIISSLFFLIKKEIDKKIIILNIFVLSVFFIQFFLFTETRSYPRYYFDLIIPTTILVIFFLSHIPKKISIVLLIAISMSSIHNIILTVKKKNGYSLYQPANFNLATNIIPENSIIITDMPNTIRALDKTSQIYALRDNNKDPELVDRNGIHYDKNTAIRDPKIFTEKQKSRFINKSMDEFILSEDQLFLYYDKTPKIMNIEHLLRLKSQNKDIYVLITHNALERKNRVDNPLLLNFIEDNSIKIIDDIQERNPFDFRLFDTKSNNPQVLRLYKII